MLVHAGTDVTHWQKQLQGAVIVGGNWWGNPRWVADPAWTLALLIKVVHGFLRALLMPHFALNFKCGVCQIGMHACVHACMHVHLLHKKHFMLQSCQSKKLSNERNTMVTFWIENLNSGATAGCVSSTKVHCRKKQHGRTLKNCASKCASHCAEQFTHSTIEVQCPKLGAKCRGCGTHSSRIQSRKWCSSVSGD